jgi:hypothetical protein
MDEKIERKRFGVLSQTPKRFVLNAETFLKSLLEPYFWPSSRLALIFFNNQIQPCILGFS